MFCDSGPSRVSLVIRVWMEVGAWVGEGKEVKDYRLMTLIFSD